VKVETFDAKRGVVGCRGYCCQGGCLRNGWSAMAGLQSMTGGNLLYQEGAEGMETS